VQLELVPDEQRPVFIECMQQHDQKAQAEARYQAAQFRLQDEQEARRLWQAQCVAVQQDLLASNHAVREVQARVDQQMRLTHAHHAKRVQEQTACAQMRTQLEDNVYVVQVFFFCTRL
jgi:hypothetical protein